MSYEQDSSDKTIKIPILKLVFDKIVSVLLLVAFLPVSIFLIVAIKTSSFLHKDDVGPLFYIEKRVSQGEHFSLIKFRIYKMSAIRLIRNGAKTKEVENSPGALISVGWLLKKWGFDEIPQLINVIKGDISLVGPRPKPIKEYEEEVSRGIYNRKQVKAGLTGPVQAMKGTHRSYEDEVVKDAEYVEKYRKYSQFMLVMEDIMIIMRTIKVMFKGTGE